MINFEELLIKWSDGTLSGTELEQLNAALADPENRTRLAHEFALSQQLRDTLRAEEARVTTAERAQVYEEREVAAVEPFPRRLAGILAHVCRQGSIWRRIALPFGVGLAAVVLVWFMSADPTIAVVESSSPGTVIQRGGRNLAGGTGFKVQSNDRVQTRNDGRVVVRYLKENSRVNLNGSTRAVFRTADSAKRVELEEGSLWASVSPQPKTDPMVFTTLHATAVVLGTELSLAIQKVGSRIEVIEGSVRVIRREDEAALVVNAGSFAQVTPQIELIAKPLLPDPWRAQDIGGIGRPGNARWEDKKCRVAGGVRKIRSPDEFHFVYQVLEGEGEIRARVLSFDSSNKGVKAGVLIRESLKSTAPTAFLRVNSDRGLEFKRRGRGETKIEDVGREKFPYWVRLTRAGDLITAYKSPDGVTWTKTASGNFDLAARIYIGLGVTSSSEGGVNSAVFDNVSVISSSPKPDEASPVANPQID